MLFGSAVIKDIHPSVQAVSVSFTVEERTIQNSYEFFVRHILSEKFRTVQEAPGEISARLAAKRNSIDPVLLTRRIRCSSECNRIKSLDKVSNT